MTAIRDGKVDEAERIIGKLMSLLTDVAGWLSHGMTETASRAIDESRKDGWALTGWRDYHRAAIARPVGDAKADAQSHLRELNAQIVLRELEWSDYEIKLRGPNLRRCPACGGLDPSQKHVGPTGHASDCRLAAVIDRPLRLDSNMRLGLERAAQIATGIGRRAFGDYIADAIRAEIASLPTDQPAGDGEPGPSVTIGYTNWRGEFAVRDISPIRMFWSPEGSNKWHPKAQWVIEAWDAKSASVRDFALSGFGRPADQAAKDDEPPCKWGGGNDFMECRTCGIEYDYRKVPRPPCPRAAVESRKK